MPVYIPIGHGEETFSKYVKRNIVPPGCSVTVIETPGSAHYWHLKNRSGQRVNPRQNNVGQNKNLGEIFEYTQLSNFLREHPDKRYIFDNPIENSEDINEIFESVAIFGPGQKYPNINYNLNLEWKYDGKYTGRRYSGLVELNEFTNPGFTTHDITHKLPHPTLGPQRRYQSEKIHEWIKNQEEIYKYSVYPPPDIFKRYFTSIDTIKQYYIDTNNHTQAERIKGGMNIKNLIELLLLDFQDDEEGYINISLRKLMALFPGNYIHIVCRQYTFSRENIDFEPYVMEELLTKRVPLMSERHIRRILNTPTIMNNINSRATQNTRRLLKTSLQKSLAQRELLSKVKKEEGQRRTRRLKKMRGSSNRKFK